MMFLMEEIHCIVSGRVQMVMFRDFTQRKARALGLSGWVRNLPDGTVEVVAQGEKGSLGKLVEKLYKGPILAKVNGVKAEWREPKEILRGFEIFYS